MDLRKEEINLNFYYNLILNLNEFLYEFYEWKSEEILNVKKVPIYRVKTKNIKDFYLYDIKVNEEFLNEIYKKSISSENIDYLAVFSDNKNSIAIEFNNEGKSIFKSKLDLDSDLTICELSYNLDFENIKYEKIKKTYKYNLNLRQEEIERKTVLKEISNLYQEKNLEKLKYLYYEISNVICNDLDKIYNNIINLIENENFNNLNYIYKIIKLSYKKEH